MEYDNEITTLCYKQIFDLSVKLSKRNDELENNIVEFHNHIKALDSENNRINDEINVLRRKKLK